MQLLRKYEAEFRLVIEEKDIDGEPQLIASYGEKVPVVLIEGRERFFGQVNEILLLRLLRAERSASGPS